MDRRTERKVATMSQPAISREQMHKNMLAQILRDDWPQMAQEQRQRTFREFPEVCKLAGVKMDDPYEEPEEDLEVYADEVE